MPVNNCAKPSCLMIYFKVYLIFFNSGLSCILTLTVSRKKPETQLTTPETMPLLKSIRKFIYYFNKINYVSNVTKIKNYPDNINNHQSYKYITQNI